MASSHAEELVYGIKLSSVGPASVTGPNVVYEPTNMDLAMKLHYLRGLYFFKTQAIEGLSIHQIKDSMFRWLDLKAYSYISGRFRRSDSGRPFIKCNDSGVRIIEAKTDNTIDEWLDMDNFSLHNLLVPKQILGPELAFSPPVLIQFTSFKCGGMSLGFNWAHVLGDLFSAADFINMWALILADHQPPKSLNIPKSQTKTRKPNRPISHSEDTLSLKRVDPVGDSWITANNCKMETFSFQVTSKQLSQLRSKIFGESKTGQSQYFESLSALIWHCLARIREESEPRNVTICRNDSSNRVKGIMGNNQIISVVNTDFLVSKADLKELATMIVEQSKNEKYRIEEVVEEERGLADFIVYGKNLTFLNLEEAEIYGLHLKEQEPIFVNYSIDGVGDEGVVLILPGPKNIVGDGVQGRTVVATLPENQVILLKTELRRELSIA